MGNKKNASFGGKGRRHLSVKASVNMLKRESGQKARLTKRLPKSDELVLDLVSEMARQTTRRK